MTDSTYTWRVRPLSRRTAHSANSSGTPPSSSSGGGLNSRRQQAFPTWTAFKKPGGEQQQAADRQRQRIAGELELWEECRMDALVPHETKHPHLYIV